MVRPYKIVLGAEQCDNCGKGMRKSYIGSQSPHRYCKSCVNTVFNLSIPEEELNIPIWLIVEIEKYVLHRLFLFQYKGIPLDNTARFVEGFYLANPRVNKKIYPELTLSIDDKVIKREWSLAIDSHLLYKRKEVDVDIQSDIRKLLPCPSCYRPMKYTGFGALGEEGRFLAYRCLSSKEACSFSREEKVLKHYQNTNKIVAELYHR